MPHTSGTFMTKMVNQQAKKTKQTNTQTGDPVQTVAKPLPRSYCGLTLGFFHCWWLRELFTALSNGNSCAPSLSQSLTVDTQKRLNSARGVQGGTLEDRFVSHGGLVIIRQVNFTRPHFLKKKKNNNNTRTHSQLVFQVLRSLYRRV